MANIIIPVILAAFCVFAVCSYVKKLRKGGGCCGEHEPAEKKIRVADKDKSHYPYDLILSVDGMTCGNCARRVENALNSLEGVWATVDLGSRKAEVRLKSKPDEASLRQAVRNAGYTVLSIQENSPSEIPA